MTIYESGWPPPLSFISQSTYGVNYIYGLSTNTSVTNTYYASANAGGVQISTNNQGQIWGVPQLSGTITTPGTILQMASGNILVFSSVATYTNPSLTWIADSGFTSATEYNFYYQNEGVGLKAVQTTGTHKYVYALYPGWAGSIWARMASPYTSWGSVTMTFGSPNNYNGSGLTITPNGTLIWVTMDYSTSKTPLAYTSANEGSSWTATATGTAVSSALQGTTTKADYHIKDDTTGFACMGPNGSYTGIYFFTYNSGTITNTNSGNPISGIGTSASTSVTYVDYVTAISGVSQNWIITYRDANNAYWILSQDGGSTWTNIYTSSLTASGQGILTNPVTVL